MNERDYPVETRIGARPWAPEDELHIKFSVSRELREFMMEHRKAELDDRIRESVLAIVHDMEHQMTQEVKAKEAQLHRDFYSNAAEQHREMSDPSNWAADWAEELRKDQDAQRIGGDHCVLNYANECAMNFEGQRRPMVASAVGKLEKRRAALTDECSCDWNGVLRGHHDAGCAYMKSKGKSS